MAFDQLFSGKVGGGSAAPSSSGTSDSTSTPSTTSQGQGGASTSSLPPALQAVGAGVAQGAVRDPAQTIVGNSWVAPVVNWVDKNVPFLGALDRWAGTTPENLAGQTQAYQQQYGDSGWASAGRLGGNVLAGAAIPGGEAAAGLAGAGRVGNFLAPAIRGAYAGGTGSALVSGGYGENPLTAGAEGALGGAIIGRLLPGGGGNTDLQNLADRLGVRLSSGQARGGALGAVEDLTERLPFSGATSFRAGQKADIVNVLERNMGIPETGSLELPQIGAARNAAGQDMSRLANGISIDGSAAATPQGTDLMTRLDNIVTDHAALGTDQQDYKAAVHLRDAIQTSLANNGGVMPGTDFARLISNGNTLDRFAGHSNSEVQDVAAKVRSALFTAADNTQGNPANIMRDFQDARLRYKAAATAADAIGPTGSTEAMTPNGLKLAINRHYADELVNPAATGAGYDIPDLSRLIRGIPKLASSGTAERLSLMNMLGIGGAGSGVLGAIGSPIALSTAAHAAVPYAAMAAAGAASRHLPLARIANAMPNQLLPIAVGQNVGRPFIGNQLTPSP